MAQLLSVVGDSGTNVIGVEHVRDAIDIHVRETGVRLTVATRGGCHAAEVLEHVRCAGYQALHQRVGPA